MFEQGIYYMTFVVLYREAGVSNYQELDKRGHPRLTPCGGV